MSNQDLNQALLLEYLETIKEQNATQIRMMEKQSENQDRLIQAHIAEDKKVHQVVDRHSVYFSILSLGIPVATAYVAKKLGFY